MPGRQRRVSISYRRSLRQRTLTWVDDHEGAPVQLRIVKMLRPSLVSARGRKPWNITMSRVKSVDAALINRKILLHFEVALQIRPHWQLFRCCRAIKKLNVCRSRMSRNDRNSGLHAKTGITLSRWAM